MILSLLIPVFCFASGALTKSLLSPCKPSDIGCVEKSLNVVYPAVISGIPSLGIESCDPLFIKEIVGNLSILKYKLFNTTVIGYKNCKIQNIKLDQELTSLHYELHCPTFKMNGIYETKGRLVILPVEGSGDYELTTGKYMITVDSELKITQDSDGKSHLSIKNFKLKNLAQEPIKIEFKNLFNGKKELSDAVHKFAHENWAEVAALVQDPIFYTEMKKIVKSINKYLETVPMDEYTLS